MKEVNINIRLDDELKCKFYEKAESNAQNPSALIRKWIQDYLKEGD